MPIRINLLAEQQAAEEARRKDPIKRALIVGGALVALAVCWALVLQMQLKARRGELANLDAAFKEVDLKAKVVKNLQSETGDIERRIRSLERYSTNRVLWASMLDGLQKVKFPQIRYRTIATTQRYPTNAPAVFFTTNLLVPFTPPRPAWKFWASASQDTSYQNSASNLFRTFVNNPPFSTNKLPYTVKMTVTVTNSDNTVTVKTEFSLPATSTQDVDVQVSGGDYGNPPGASLDEFARQLSSSPYFSTRLTQGEERARFTDLPPRPEPDLSLPNNPLYRRFTLRMKYEDRVVSNE